MRDQIQMKGGQKAPVGILADREIFYCREENALYIGSLGSNKKIYGEEMEGKLTAIPIESLEELSNEADLATVIAAWNAMLSAMKESGIMKA